MPVAWVQIITVSRIFKATVMVGYRYISMLLRLLILVLLFLPMLSEAKNLVPCGGESEPACQSCHAVGLVNGVVVWLVGILGIITSIIVVYAGFKLVTSAGNTAAKTQAKSLMTNVLIGYVIVLSAWLVIDYGMKAMVDQGTFGVWNEVQCVDQPTARWSNPEAALAEVAGWASAGVTGTMQATCDIVPGPGLVYDCSAQIAECNNITGGATVNAAGNMVTCAPAQGGTVDATGLGQCSPSNSACSVSALQAAGLDSREANIMSCIAMTESSGIASTPPYNIAHPGSSSSACGTFQVVRTTWEGTATGACSDFSNCQTASCNLQVAVTLVNESGYSSWTCPGCNAKADRCVSVYGG